MQKPTFHNILKWIPTGAGFGVTIHFVQNHEWIQALVTSFLTASMYLWTRFSKTFMEILGEAAEESGKSVAQWLLINSNLVFTRLWQELISPFERQYCQNLIYTHRSYRTEGLITRGPFTPDLDKVFVPLRVASTSLGTTSSSIIQTQETSGELEIWNFLAEMNAVPAYKRMVILGAPGSGKTTLLEHLTLSYAKHQERTYNRAVPRLIPILLFLRDIRNEIACDDSPSLSILVTELLKNSEFTLTFEPQVSWFEMRLKQGRCLVMLDGLDEVADPHQRKNISAWVDTQMKRYPKTAFILSSRPFGYRNAELKEVRTCLNVKPFNSKQINNFLHHWYLQNEMLRQARKADEGVRKIAFKKAEDLIKRIKNYAPIADMANNPLLLTMIATVHDNRGALPGSRLELYKEICEVLLARRQEDKNIPDSVPLTVEQKQKVLQSLALGLTCNGTREFDLDQGKSLIQSELSSVTGGNMVPDRFIQYVEQVTGLLVERELGIYEFAHRSFQEYLTANEVKEKNYEDLLINNINDPWWSETIRLYAGRNDVTNLIQAALRHSTIISLALAYDCLEDGKSVHPDTRDQLEEKLKLDRKSTDPELSRLAAEVQLSRRLRHA
jgi:predicted NACHT family NTPase